MVNIVNYDIKIFNSINELSHYFTEFLKSEINLKKNKFSLVLSGGNTPEPVYQYLAEQKDIKLNWDKINFFWGDERCVPPENIESNFRMANELLLSKINVRSENIFRIKGEAEPNSESRRYSEVIKQNVSQEKFDLILLGIGEDGHVASIFPNQMDLIFDNEICKVSTHPSTNQKRITLTGKVINNAKNIIFLATGKKKSQIVSDILSRKENSIKYPASYINPINGKLIWLLDKDAGEKIRL